MKQIRIAAKSKLKMIVISSISCFAMAPESPNTKVFDSLVRFVPESWKHSFDKKFRFKLVPKKKYIKFLSSK